MCNIGKFVKEFEVTKYDALVAYRAWQLDDNKLISLFFGHYQVWNDKDKVEADQLPNEDNESGLYSFKTRQKLEKNYRKNDFANPIVYGKIIIWGQCVEHEFGYRAQFAQFVNYLEESELSFWGRILSML